MVARKMNANWPQEAEMVEQEKGEGKGEGEEARKDDKVWSNEIMPVYLATDDDNRNFVVGGGARRGRL